MVKRLLQILTAALVSVAFIGSAASAATCDSSITLTGPGSNNTISCTDVTSIVVTCVNNVNVATIDVQTGTTGSAGVVGNTTGNSATTGSVVNDNGQNVTIGASCGTTPTPTPTPVVPGGGNVTPISTKPAVLPFTAGNNAAAIVAGSLVAAAIIVAASRLAIAAYRRISVK